ncbi:hypothetical protein [Aeromicrobium sp. Leaf350]|uniref:hypothetical protein n=1 Tax=Aeromicrobium sp. Leaf350 TaxID=2876565 RepID=UPI001E633806|nr:hypothetical protein [Aeromicrobium sp. Leaf350]
MFTVSWRLADGATGDVEVRGRDRFSFGRHGCTVDLDVPGLSREALVIRDTAPGPVVFRGQRDNGAFVALVTLLGQRRWIEQGTAANLTADVNRVELHLGGEVVFLADVSFGIRPRTFERLLPEPAPTA